MYTQLDRPKDNQSRVADHSVAQKKGKTEQYFNFKDNRSETIAQRKLVNSISNNPQVKQLKPLQGVIGQSQKTSGMLLSQNVYTSQLRANKIVLPSGRTHYNDGWGARYDITTDDELKAEIRDTDIGSGGIDLGWQDAPENEQPNPPDGTKKEKKCKIKFRDASERNTTAIYHCGPTGPAHWYNV